MGLDVAIEWLDGRVVTLAGRAKLKLNRLCQTPSTSVAAQPELRPPDKEGLLVTELEHRLHQ